MRARFRDRFQAGRLLAMELAGYADRPDVLVLGMPREGVPVAFEVARALQAPLDVFVVHELVALRGPVARLGTIATGGVVLLDSEVAAARVPAHIVNEAIEEGRAELDRRERIYRGERAPHDISARTILLVDDQLGQGSLLRAAVAAIRCLAPLRLVVAVPAASGQRRDDLRRAVDDLVCLTVIQPGSAAGLSYDDATPTADDHVRELLELADELQLVA